MGNCSSQSTENSHEIDLYLKSKMIETNFFRISYDESSSPREKRLYS